jgi:hypothetical protein
VLLAVCCKTVVAGDVFVLWDFVFDETVGTGYLVSLCVSKLRLLVFRASFACAHTFFRSCVCVLRFVLLLG